MERCEANSEDHQDSGQKPDGTSPSSSALLWHQALTGGEEAGEAESEAHHSEHGEEELQNSEVEVGRKDNAGGAEIQRCGLEGRGKRERGL